MFFLSFLSGVALFYSFNYFPFSTLSIGILSSAYLIIRRKVPLIFILLLGVQAVVTRRTGRGTVWNIVLALFAVLFAALAFTTSDRAGAITLWSIAGVFLLMLLINALRAPTCVTHLQTAVSREDLPSLNRLRVARKVINRLRPLIEAAQGVLSAEEMRARAAEAARLPRPEAAAGAAGPAGARPLFPYTGGAHAALFLLLLLDGAMSAADIFLNSVALPLAGTLLMMSLSFVYEASWNIRWNARSSIWSLETAFSLEHTSSRSGGTPVRTWQRQLL